MDFYGTCDPYVVIKLEEGATVFATEKTKVVGTNTANPVFLDADYSFALHKASSTKIVVEVMDEESMSTDTLIGRYTLAMTDLMGRPGSVFREKVALADLKKKSTKGESSITFSCKWQSVSA